MDIGHVREFVCLAQNLNFTAAAQRCFISQSVLSRHISAMEQELGTKLFVRNQQRVRLTKQGETFLADMLNMLEVYDAALAKIEKAEKNAGEILRVGYLQGAASSFLMEACTAFQSRNPDVHVRLHAFEHEELREALEKGAVDVSLTMTFSQPNPSWYSSMLVYRDRHGIMVDKQSHFAQCGELSLSDLAGETLLVPNRERYRTYSAFLMHAIREADSELDVADGIYDANDYAMQAKVRDYVTIIPGHLARFYDFKDMQFVPLSNESLAFDVRAVWKTSHESRTITHFIEAIKGASEHASPEAPETTEEPGETRA